LTPKLRKNFGQSHFRTALSRLKRSKVTKKGSKVRIFRGSAEHLIEHSTVIFRHCTLKPTVKC
jgi:hypothetical protein